MLRDKDHCYGCNARANACPKNAIEMKENAEGFIYPSVIEEKCIHCGACERACSERTYQHDLGDAYIAQSKDDSILKQSTSGGIIPEVAKRIVSMNGVVCSTTYHVTEGGLWKFAYDEEALKEFYGSKYFQIPLTLEVMATIKKELKTRPVLVIGTPCQVNAINNIVDEKQRTNLYTIDLICGGTVSGQFEEAYIACESKRANNKTISEHFFRSKSQGWSRKYLTELICTDGSKISRIGSKGLFTRAYSSGMFLRPSCYNCEFCTKTRTGDITVGDCWGIDTEAQFDISKGVSMVFINSDQGRKLFKSIESIKSKPSEKNKLAKENKPLYTRHKRKALRSISYRLIRTLGFKKAVDICAYRYHIKRIIGRS